MNLLNELKNNPFLLAPMAGVTDCAFRSYMKHLGCGIVTTELISSHGIRYQSEQTLKLMKTTREQFPVGVQLFGETPEAVAEAAKYVQEQGANFVDLNFGCPVKKVVSKGAGSAILRDLNQVQKMVSTVKAAIEIPLTIKIRTGWDHNTRNADEVCNIAYNEGVTWVSIHGRTRAQAYEGLADWDYIAEVKSKTKVPVIGNGDILSPQGANQRLSESGCDGVMIGRGCLKNPLIFLESQKLFLGESVERVNIHPLQQLLLLKQFLEEEHDDKTVGIQLKKFAAWYSAGYPGSAGFRKTIFMAKTIDDIVIQIQSYFDSIGDANRGVFDEERFMMGGHG
ncbi:MAG: tRNA dihydrouridine synthase DusB [Bdellovibrionales bacterium]|nr:tRNA dihydrouridine synthase DusB [Bdellovibrionales bacterium]